MPSILDETDYQKWLDPTERPPDQLLPLLRPYPSEQMVAHPVSRAVNSPRHDDPSNIEPLRDMPESLFG
jgi:putative SOS response-associated peptidase YedK